ncbi:hypothetical protein DFH07DRAFT_965371 [Mycena maculata]|uniref:Uncharacterized protein n=1 Tax=Mycena maculata TaxID=230809 RepID=A0AAD7IDZ5_9AGAR|nr:hypothetical protein DFH07DRAFT_965371 [Mycena maculata]
MTQIVYPFKFSLHAPSVGPFFVHGVELEYVTLENGTSHSGRRFTEFQPPSYFLRLNATPHQTLLASHAHVLESQLIQDLQRRFPHSPLHPDRASHTTFFQRAAATLSAQLACSNAIFFRLVRLHDQSEAAAAASATAHAATIAPLSTDEIIAAASGLSVRAVSWLGTTALGPHSAFHWSPAPNDSDADDDDQALVPQVVGTWGGNSDPWAASNAGGWGMGNAGGWGIGTTRRRRTQAMPRKRGPSGKMIGCFFRSGRIIRRRPRTYMEDLQRYFALSLLDRLRVCLRLLCQDFR